jgi:hypothetical protein
MLCSSGYPLKTVATHSEQCTSKTCLYCDPLAIDLILGAALWSWANSASKINGFPGVKGGQLTTSPPFVSRLSRKWEPRGLTAVWATVACCKESYIWKAISFVLFCFMYTHFYVLQQNTVTSVLNMLSRGIPQDLV